MKKGGNYMKNALKRAMKNANMFQERRKRGKLE